MLATEPCQLAPACAQMRQVDQSPRQVPWQKLAEATRDRASDGPAHRNQASIHDAHVAGCKEARDSVQGQMTLANPDFAERLKTNAPLNEADRNGFFGGTAQGYIDYPTLSEAGARSSHDAPFVFSNPT